MRFKHFWYYCALDDAPLLPLSMKPFWGLSQSLRPQWPPHLAWRGGRRGCQGGGGAVFGWCTPPSGRPLGGDGGAATGGAVGGGGVWHGAECWRCCGWFAVLWIQMRQKLAHIGTVLHSSDNGVADLLHTKKSTRRNNRVVSSYDDAVADLLWCR